MSVSHVTSFKAQPDFAPESKIKVGNDVWSSATAGARFYAEVLSKRPTTVQKVLDLASELKSPFTLKQTMGHLKWMYTAGELEVDGKSYVVPSKELKLAKQAKVKVAASHQRRLVRTKKLTAKRAA